jgi:hypothetical protein
MWLKQQSACFASTKPSFQIPVTFKDRKRERERERERERSLILFNVFHFEN